MRLLRLILVFLIALLLGFAGCFFYFIHSPKPGPPSLSASIRHESIQVSDRVRVYEAYIPQNHQAGMPLLLVFHGSLQTPETLRRFTGYEFERLADENGFMVVYPKGYKKNWNDCRSTATYPARVENIDDKGFTLALIRECVSTYQADPQQVFAVGFSNGGHFVFRLALENPEDIAGIAVISANVPTPDNSDCTASDRPLPTLIMNGTEDPLNPYDGGTVSLFGFGDRGTVLSSYESALYFAGLAGYTEGDAAARILFPDQPVSVKIQAWKQKNKPPVVLYSLLGGGHLIPQPRYRAPRILGPNAPYFNGPEAIWDFFASARLK